MKDYTADIAKDIQRLDNVIADLLIDKEARDMLPAREQNAAICSMAYHLQALFTGLEKIMEKSLASLEVKLKPDGSYHITLLKEYCARFDCPAEEKIFLKDILNFRHVVRSAYGFPLDAERVMEKYQTAITLWPRIKERVIRQMDLPPPAEPPA